MTTNQIEPALTAEGWEKARYYHSRGQQLDEYEGDTPDVRAYLIALNNDGLPDSDPRKITRDWVDALRELAATIDQATANKMIGSLRLSGPGGTFSFRLGDDFEAMAAALESYLPPLTDT